MKEIFSHADSMRIGHAKSILEAEGIACFIRNEVSHNLIGGSLVGQLKLFDPVLCLADDDDYSRAMELLDHSANGRGNHYLGPDWTCAACGQSVPGSFGECWSCHTMRPALTKEE